MEILFIEISSRKFPAVEIELRLVAHQEVAHVDALDVVDGTHHNVLLQLRVDLVQTVLWNGPPDEARSVGINNERRDGSQDAADEERADGIGDVAAVVGGQTHAHARDSHS